MERRSSFLAIVGIAPPPSPAILGLASTFHTQRKKTKREGRAVTITAVLAG
jgi:hypothetical protein